MKAADRIIELQTEKKKLEEILYSLKAIFFGQSAYNHNFSELIEEVQGMKEAMARVEGKRDAAMELLQQENYRLYLLVRFLSGDNDAFKPMTNIDVAHGLSKKFPPFSHSDI